MKRIFLLQLLLNALLGLLFLIAGIAITTSYWTAAWYEPLILFFEENLWALLLTGVAIAVIGFRIFGWSLSLMHHGQYEFVSGLARISIDEAIIQKFFSDYITREFPKESTSSHVVIKNNELTLLAEVPSKIAPEQILRMKDVLTSELNTRFGYRGPFTLSFIKG